MAHAQAQHVGHAGGQPATSASSEHVGHADEHAAHGGAHAGSHAQGQQHPLGIYFKIWGLLFVLSVGSYLVDFFHVQGYLRWSLIVVLMLLKAGLIVAVFMHMLWERLALMYAIVVPPVLLLVLLGIGAFEADYTFFTRGTFFAPAAQAQAPAKHH